jgi:hypothetical protein
MAKKDAFWFKHDANSQDDPKCMLLIDQLGMEGYGIFWALLEKLRAENNHTLPLLSIPSFARRWATSTEKINAVVKNYNLFVVSEDGKFYSERLTNDMKDKSESARLSASYRWGNANGMRPHPNALPPDANGMRSDAKRKEEKRKEKKRGGVGEIAPVGAENTGAYFDLREGKGVVRLNDGKEQKLGPQQLEKAKNKELQPYEIIEGKIF